MYIQRRKIPLLTPEEAQTILARPYETAASSILAQLKMATTDAGLFSSKVLREVFGDNFSERFLVSNVPWRTGLALLRKNTSDLQTEESFSCDVLVDCKALDRIAFPPKPIKKPKQKFNVTVTP